MAAKNSKTSKDKQGASKQGSAARPAAADDEQVVAGSAPNAGAQAGQPSDAVAQKQAELNAQKAAFEGTITSVRGWTQKFTELLEKGDTAGAFEALVEAQKVMPAFFPTTRSAPAGKK